LCITDFPIWSPDRWLWNYLPDSDDEVDFMWAQPEDRSRSWGKFVTRYPDYIRLAQRAMRRLEEKDYDLIVAWESKVGIPMGMLRYVSRQTQPPFVLLTFTAGDLPSSFRPLTNVALQAVDHVTVLTSAEIDTYQGLFNLSRSKISLNYLGTYDVRSEVLQRAENLPILTDQFIHASGRSARDYATLIRAVDGLSIRTIIHGRHYLFDTLNLPPNVEVGDMVPEDQYSRLLRDTLFEVVPLRDTILPVGSSQIVSAMMMGKAIVATHTTSTSDYVEDGVTGILVEPGSVESLRGAIQYLLAYPHRALEMGQAARQRFEERYTFERFAHRTHHILQRVAKGFPLNNESLGTP
jgi:hypothetical protein